MVGLELLVVCWVLLVLCLVRILHCHWWFIHRVIDMVPALTAEQDSNKGSNTENEL